jgi:exopolyphosphatase/guanosine-5'-triphosphate,3'-diphosphate pyrophosphatase
MSRGVTQAEALLEGFGWEVDHCRQVRDLALSLFDQLQPLHQLGPEQREVLDAAALLHDIGWTISGSKHHKHSYQLIRDHEAQLTGFGPRQVALIANVARYHRKAAPAPHHEGYAALTPGEQRVVQKLAALLRLADGLDRPHLQSVKLLQCTVTDRHVLIGVKSLIDPGLHIAGALRKRGFFETVYGVSVEFSIL